MALARQGAGLAWIVAIVMGLVTVAVEMGENILKIVGMGGKVGVSLFVLFIHHGCELTCGRVGLGTWVVGCGHGQRARSLDAEGAVDARIVLLGTLS